VQAGVMDRIRLDDLEFIGAGLARPECVLTTRSGDLFASDRAGVAVLKPDGEVRRIPARDPPPGFLPNGIALMPDRSFLIADLGPGGGVYHMAPDGTLTPSLREIDGRPLPPTNFVGIDREGRVWVTVSTWLIPREQAFRKGYADGFIILIDERGARIVAEGIGSTNEAIVDPTGAWLYVNETIGRRTSRFPVRSDGSLGPKEVVAEYGPGTFPDGLAFDAEGGVWIVSVVSNRVVRVDRDGRQHILLEDADPAVLERVEQAFDAGSFGRPEIDTGGRRRLGNISSLAFGDDLHTVYLGTLFGERIARFRTHIKGAPAVHWEF
jgi:sugar lactone lactonase YvrE